MSHPRRNLHLLIGCYANRPAVCVQGNINTARKVRITILAHLHLGVDHTRVLPLPVDVVHLGEVILLSKGGIEDVVEVNWQDVQETGGP